VRIGWNRVE